MRVLAVGALVAGILAATDAKGAGVGLKVERDDATSECPAEDELLAVAGAVRSASSRPSHSYRVAFERAGRGFQADIFDETAGRSRHLQDLGASCVALGRAAAIVLATMWDSETDTGHVPPAVRPAPRVAPPTPGADMGRRRAGEASGWVFGAGGGVAVALVRPAAPSVLGVVTLESGGLSVGIGALWVDGQGTEVGPGTIDVQLLSAQAEGCIFSPRSTRLGACLRVLGGELLASANGYSVNSDGARPWFALGIGPFLEGPVPLLSRVAPLSYRLSVTAVVPLHAEVFSVTGAGDAYDTPPVGALVSLLVEASTRRR